jgi:HD-GYP domain-containing protein (c-di-GMP phosphodiesterase class II)
VDACLEVLPQQARLLDDVDHWDRALAVEPLPWARLHDDELDRALTAVADFADLKSPALWGHSRRVAELASGAARWCGLGESAVTTLRRAGLVHDVGRVGVPGLLPGQREPSGEAQRERDRLHPYLTERVLARCAPLAPYAAAAAGHHERLDGRGFHRGLRRAQLDTATRLLAAADALALAEARHPQGRGTMDSGAAVHGLVRDGALDEAAAEAVLGVASGGTPRGHHRAPGGLTDRETEILGLVATGLTNRQIAGTLHLSPKTVGRHVDNVLAKTGTHSRAAAAVLALEQGLVSS